MDLAPAPAPSGAKGLAVMDPYCRVSSQVAPLAPVRRGPIARQTACFARCEYDMRFPSAIDGAGSAGVANEWRACAIDGFVSPILCAFAAYACIRAARPLRQARLAARAAAEPRLYGAPPPTPPSSRSARRQARRAALCASVACIAAAARAMLATRPLAAVVAAAASAALWAAVGFVSVEVPCAGAGAPRALRLARRAALLGAAALAAEAAAGAARGPGAEQYGRRPLLWLSAAGCFGVVFFLALLGREEGCAVRGEEGAEEGVEEGVVAAGGGPDGQTFSSPGVCPEWTAGLFSHVTFSWMSPLISRGVSHALEQSDLWSLPPPDRVEALERRFGRYWQRELDAKLEQLRRDGIDPNGPALDAVKTARVARVVSSQEEERSEREAPQEGAGAEAGAGAGAEAGQSHGAARSGPDGAAPRPGGRPGSPSPPPPSGGPPSRGGPPSSADVPRYPITVSAGALARACALSVAPLFSLALPCKLIVDVSQFAPPILISEMLAALGEAARQGSDPGGQSMAMAMAMANGTGTGGVGELGSLSGVGPGRRLLSSSSSLSSSSPSSSSSQDASLPSSLSSSSVAPGLISIALPALTPIGRAYACAALLFVALCVGTIADNQHFQLVMRGGFRLRSVLTHRICDKVLRLTPDARGRFFSGKLYSAVGTDVDQLQFLSQTILGLVSAPLRIVVAVALLWRCLGPASVGAVALVVLVMPLQAKLMTLQRATLRGALARTDERAKLEGELVTGLEAVKCAGWEEPFLARAARARALELGSLRTAAKLSSANVAIVLAVPVLSAVGLFGFYSLFTRSSPTAVQAFTALSLLAVMRFPMFQLPALITGLIAASVAVERLAALLSAPEAKPIPPLPAVERGESATGEEEEEGEEDVTVRDGDDLDGPEIRENGVETGLGKQIRAESGRGSETRPQSTTPIANAHAPSPSPSPSSSSSSPSSSSSAVRCLSPSDVASIPPPLRRYSVVLRGSFSWSLQDPPSISDLDLCVRPGELVAVVGPTGSGKSSLLAALLGLLEPVWSPQREARDEDEACDAWQGEEQDGASSSGKSEGSGGVVGSERGSTPRVQGHLTPSSFIAPLAIIRGGCAYVPQTAYIASATIRENVVFNSTDVDNALRLGLEKGTPESLEAQVDRLAEGGDGDDDVDAEDDVGVGEVPGAFVGRSLSGAAASRAEAATGVAAGEPDARAHPSAVPSPARLDASFAANVRVLSTGAASLPPPRSPGFQPPFSPPRYASALRAACLAPDLAAQPAGDLTELGERGVTISGGQKQRVALARAAYARPAVALLDDPLSALDAKVGRRVFSRLVKGALRDSTRLLVTNQLQYVRDCDRVLYLERGRVVEQGTYEQLLKNGQGFAKLIAKAVQEDVEEEEEEEEEEDEEEEGKSAGEKCAVRETPGPKESKNGKKEAENEPSDVKPSDVKPSKAKAFECRDRRGLCFEPAVLDSERGASFSHRPSRSPAPGSSSLPSSSGPSSPSLPSGCRSLQLSPGSIVHRPSESGPDGAAALAAALREGRESGPELGGAPDEVYLPGGGGGAVEGGDGDQEPGADADVDAETETEQQGNAGGSAVKGSGASTALERPLAAPSSSSPPPSSPPSPPSASAQDGALYEEEGRSRGRIKRAVVATYARALGGARVVALVAAAFVFVEVFRVAGQLWLQHWTSVVQRSVGWVLPGTVASDRGHLGLRLGELGGEIGSERLDGRQRVDTLGSFLVPARSAPPSGDSGAVEAGNGPLRSRSSHGSLPPSVSLSLSSALARSVADPWALPARAPAWALGAAGSSETALMGYDWRTGQMDVEELAAIARGGAADDWRRVAQGAQGGVAGAWQRLWWSLHGGDAQDGQGAQGAASRDEADGSGTSRTEQDHGLGLAQSLRRMLGHEEAKEDHGRGQDAEQKAREEKAAKEEEASSSPSISPLSPSSSSSSSVSSFSSSSVHASSLLSDSLHSTSSFASSAARSTLSLLSLFSPAVRVVLAASSVDPTPYLAVYAVLSLFQVVSTALSQYGMRSRALRAAGRLHGDMLARLAGAQMRFFHVTPSGRVVNRLTRDTADVDRQLPDFSSMMLTACLQLVSAVALVVALSPPVALVVAPSAYLFYVLFQRYQRSVRELKRVDALTRSPVYGSLGEAIAGVASLRAYGAERAHSRRAAAFLDDNIVVSLAMQSANRWLSMRMETLSAGLAAAAAVCVAAAGASPALAGNVLTTALGFTTFVGMTLRSASVAETAFNSVERVLEYSTQPPLEDPSAWPRLARAADATRVGDERDERERRGHRPGRGKRARGGDREGGELGALEAVPDSTSTSRLAHQLSTPLLPPAAPSPPGASSEFPPPAWPYDGTIAYEDVAMRYRAGLPLVLRGLSFTIPGGSSCGVVGRTGAGKSSLVGSLFRLTPICGGTISIGGLDASRVPLRRLRRAMAVIPQFPVLFVGTVRFNLDPTGERSDAELWTALRRAHLKDAVEADPRGLDLPIAEGGAPLSAGQRQLLALARALLVHAKILILDEATASVDVETDSKIQHTVRTEFADCTVLAVAHRLHTVADFDRILVMDAGRAVEFGAPDQLLEDQDGIFASMVRETGKGGERALKRAASQAALARGE